MLAKLLERLDALAEAAESIRAKATGKAAKRLDGLAVAKATVAVDSMARKLAALEEGLQSGLFEEGGSA